MTSSSEFKSSVDRRDILIAINAALPGGLQTAYKLATSLESWAGLRPECSRGNALEKQAQLLEVPTRALRQALALLPRAHQLAESELRGCRKIGARIFTRFDACYPPSLLDLELPPPVLYVLGELPAAPAVSIVGSRRSDPYGLEVAELFAIELARAGLSIVSGLALGVDSAAHRGALRVDGDTIAVLGCGIDVLYPRANRRLADDIASTGAIVTEFPLAARPERWRFPVRNRIIAGLSVATLVVRATPRSGSLITARHALDLTRDVYAVPGDIFDRRSVGPNSLIRDGAYPVQHPREIVELLPSRVHLLEQSSSPDLPEGELDNRLAAVLELLPRGRTMSEEKLVATSPLELDQTLAALLELEIGGWVRRHPGPSFVRTSSSHG